MTTAEIWTIVLTVVGTAINVGLFAGLLLQLRQFQRATENDHRRARKEATVDFLMSTFNNARELRAQGLPELLAADVEPFANRPLDMADERNRVIRHFLNEFETLGTGLHLDVYDEDVIYTLRNATVVRAWGLFEPWIQARREFLEQPELYVELERMAGRMQEMRAEEGKEPIPLI
ncbi:MAG: DUF4760 domain-containing protein [Acidimicrobiales bacterium]|nr:DUF4760 domain-containing protein [Acidimicrobiales bacterium]